MSSFDHYLQRILIAAAAEARAEGSAATEAHHVLLGAGLIILENADLDAVPPGAYELVCLPAKLVDADGAFARAILIRRD